MSDDEAVRKKARVEPEVEQPQDDAPPPAAAPVAAAPAQVRTVDLGGVTVCAVGLGTLPMGVSYPDPASRPNSEATKALVAAAAAAAAPFPLFVDTGDTYCTPYKARGSLERELGSIAKASPTPLVFSTKSGMNRVSDESNGWRPGDSGPAAVRKAIVAAKAALSPEGPLFLWSLHHTDGLKAPGALEASLAEAAKCVAEGLLLHVGLCNATVGQLERALGVVPILAVQNEWSLWQREAEKPLPPTAAAASKKGVLSACASHNVAFVAYSPLGGLKARRRERTAAEFGALTKLAGAKGASPQAVALACLLHRGAQMGARVVAIPGARVIAHAADSVAASRIVLLDGEVASVMGPVVG